MTNYINFQTQITTIMEAMTKSAIAEITKVFDDSSSVLRLKISRSLYENEALKKKLRLLQHELRTARGQKGRRAEPPVNAKVQVFVEEQHTERGFGQEWSFGVRRDGEPAGVEESASMETVSPEPVHIKEERPEEDLCYRDPQPTQQTPAVDEGRLDTEPTLIGDPEELSEKHTCELSDEELCGLEFVVKAEQERDCVAQKLNQTGSEHSAGRLHNLGSEYIICGRDSQLVTSFTQRCSDIETDDPVCSNSTDQCSQNLSVPRQLQHAPATMEVSGSTLSSFGASYVEEFDTMSEKLSVCSEELRSEAIHTQQGQYRERLVHAVERENQTLLQQHGPSVKHMRRGKSPSQPHSGSHTGYTVNTSVFSAGKKGKADGQADFGKKPFICIYCGKGFDCCSHLISHHRIHTGEKPFSCAQCGKSFSLKGNLVKHGRVHSGYKPFGCTQCGKRFAWEANLRAHHRSHTGERPYHCTQCGKSFSQQRNLVVHQRIHTELKPYSCN